MPGSLADLRRAFYNGGGDAELASLQAFYDEGLTVQDVLDAAEAAHNGTIPILHGIVADGVTDNSAVFNLLPADTGRVRLPKGPILCKKPIHIPKSTIIEGLSSSTSNNAIGSIVPNGIVFDFTTIMSGGNGASVVANGATWVFTVPAGHGLSAGDSFTGSGFTNAGFNVSSLIDSVTPTTLTVINTTSPAANDNGGGNAVINVHCTRLGPMDAFAPSTDMRDVFVECRRILGSIGIYSSSIQEAAGLSGVVVHNAMYRGILVDSSDPLSVAVPGAPVNINALNYRLRDIKISGSTTAPSTYSGIQIIGNNVTIRGMSGVTCTGGGSGGNLPAAQIRLDGCRGTRVTDVHTENATTGILIGNDVACIGLSVEGVSGNPTALTTVVTISSNTSSQQLILESIMLNGSTNSIIDNINGLTLTTSVGLYTTDLNGKTKTNTAVDGVVAVNLGGDVAIGTAITNILNITLTVGRHIVVFTLTAVPGATTSAIEMSLTAGTATISTTGGKSASLLVVGTQAVTNSFVTVINVTVAGTVTMRAQATTAAATAKASTPVNGFGNATSIVAQKAA